MKPENLKADVMRLWSALAVATTPREDRLKQQAVTWLAQPLLSKAAYFKRTYARFNPLVDVDDLVQEASIAIVGALGKAKKHEPPTAPLSYLLTVADHAMLQAVFAANRGDISLDDLPDDIPQLVFDWTESADARVVIEAALEGLPCNLQHVVRNRYWDRLTQAETGERLNISRGRVAQLEKQALEKLKITLTM